MYKYKCFLNKLQAYRILFSSVLFCLSGYYSSAGSTSAGIVATETNCEYKLTHAPVIDGVIKPEEWSKAASLTLVPDKDGMSSESPHHARLGYTDDGIYLAVSSSRQTIQEAVDVDDTFSLFKYDTIELFLSPGLHTDRYFHFAVTPFNSKYDAVGHDNSYDMQWNCRASSDGQKKWSAEFFIPFAGLGFADMEKTWKVQVATTCHQTDGTSQLARWPRGSGSFHQLSNFAVFGPLCVDFSKFGDSVRIKQTSPLVIGDNRIKAIIENRTGFGKKLKIRIKYADSQNNILKSVILPVSNQQHQNIDIHFSAKELKNIAVSTTLLGSAGEKIFCAPATILRSADSAIIIRMRSPWYRDTIYSSCPVRKVEFDVRLAFDQSYLSNKMLNVEFMHAGGRTQPIVAESGKAGKLQLFSFDNIGNIPPGDYVIKATVLNSKLKSIESAEKLIHKLSPPAKGNEVVFDKNKTLLLNGKPFFPLGVILDNMDAPLRSCCKDWNMVKPTGYGLTSPASRWFDIYAKQLDVAKNTNRMFILSMKGLVNKWDDPQTRYACRTAVEKFRNHPALLAWYLEDEINGRITRDRKDFVKRWKRVVEDFKEWDPYHPVINVISPNMGRGYRDFEIYAPIPDIQACDIYPIPFKRSGERISKIADSIQRLKNAAGDKSVIWFVPQIAGWQHYREPTVEEMRCMSFAALAGGARGLLAFAVQYPMWTERDGYKDMYMTKDGINNANLVATELRSYSDIFNGEDYPATCSASNAVAVIKKTDKGIFLLAVNMTYDIKQLTISAPLMKEFRIARSKGMEQAIKDGVFSDSFAPLASRIYTLMK